MGTAGTARFAVEKYALLTSFLTAARRYAVPATELQKKIQHTKDNHPTDWMIRGINVYQCRGSVLDCTISPVKAGREIQPVAF